MYFFVPSASIRGGGISAKKRVLNLHVGVCVHSVPVIPRSISWVPYSSFCVYHIAFRPCHMAILIFLSVSRFYFVNSVTRITHFYSHFYSLRYNKALFLNAYSCACMCSLTCIYTCNHTFKHFIRMFAPYRVSAYVGTFVSKPLNLFSQTLTHISTHICI